jgi:hypothetical protein
MRLEGRLAIKMDKELETSKMILPVNTCSFEIGPYCSVDSAARREMSVASSSGVAKTTGVCAVSNAVTSELHRRLMVEARGGRNFGGDITTQRSRTAR